jgi:hypothetical protein
MHHAIGVSSGMGIRAFLNRFVPSQIRSGTSIGGNAAMFNQTAEAVYMMDMADVVRILQNVCGGAGLFGNAEKDAPPGIDPTKPPDKPADATNCVKPRVIINTINGEAFEETSITMGAGDVINIGNLLTHDKLTPIGDALTAIDLYAAISKAEYTKATFITIDAASSYYGTMAKFIYWASQTDFMKAGVGTIFYTDFMEAQRMYLLTPKSDNKTRDYYINIMIHNENLLRSNYFNSLKPKN